MGLFNKLKKKGEEKQEAVQARVEEYMSLIRVYYQAVMVVNLGITNINAAPDMATFKRLLKIPTERGKLGIAEKARAKKMLMEEYGLSSNFFVEIETSIKRNCKRQQDVQTYLYSFQGFANDLMTAIGSLMQYKIRIPLLFKKTLYKLIEQTMLDITNRQKDWKKDDVRALVFEIRNLREKLGYSESWMTEYLFPVILIAKGAKKTKL
ncbi:MAG: hypothetical protein WCQ86_08310 [Bacteroidaceae bacterium]